MRRALRAGAERPGRRPGASEARACECVQRATFLRCSLLLLRDQGHEWERLHGYRSSSDMPDSGRSAPSALIAEDRRVSDMTSCENRINKNRDRTRGEGNQTGSEGRSGSPLEKFSMRYSQNSLSTSEISGVRMATMGALWLTSFRRMLLATIMPFRTR